MRIRDHCHRRIYRCWSGSTAQAGRSWALKSLSGRPPCDAWNWWRCTPGASTMPTVEWPAVQSRAHQVLADGLAGWQDCYPDVTVQRIVVHNDPARHLLEKSCSAQLLVVGSHGRGGSMLLGSVTTAVIEAADIPVIVAR